MGIEPNADHPKLLRYLFRSCRDFDRRERLDYFRVHRYPVRNSAFGTELLSIATHMLLVSSPSGSGTSAQHWKKSLKRPERWR
jgi:hypothetical protein